MQPRAVPAPAIPCGDRPEADARRGSAAQGPPRAAGPPASTPCAVGVSREDFLQVDIPEACAPAVLPDATCDIPRHLHEEPAQGFHPEGTPNVKPTGQHHICSHKWRVVCKLGTVYLTISRHCRHEGRRLPYAFVQGSLRTVVGVALLFDP